MKTIALIVGVSEYKDPALEALPGAYTDATRFSSALQSWGLPSEWIVSLSQEKATKTELIKAFYECRAAFDVDAKFIFYFAGHGVRDSESALLLHDADAKNPLSSGLRLAELVQLIRDLKPVEAFLFLDACNLRFNTLDNPLLSAANAKGLFCMLSSGPLASYENAQGPGGLFTTALLKALAEVRLNDEPTCHHLVAHVERSLLTQNLAAPEVYHIGSSKIWPLDTSYTINQPWKEKTDLVERWQAHAKLQNYLVTHNHPIIWMCGEAGLGKSVLAEQFTKKQKEAIYTSLSTLQGLVEQIRTQKSELFFNRPPEPLLHLALQHISSRYPHTLIIIDHIDHASTEELQELIAQIEKTTLSYLLISRYACPKNHFLTRRNDLIEWQAMPLTISETDELLKNTGFDSRLSSMLLSATQGNALKIQQMLAKLSGHDIPIRGKATDEFIKCITAIAACGGFIDALLFCKLYKVKASTLATLEKLGLIRYHKEGCFAHDLLEELVEENGWPVNSFDACRYWNEQVYHTPHNRLACRSLVLLASHLENVKPFKRSLGQCLETLNEREYKTYLLDLVTIFKTNNWVDLLLKASDYLIDHEEYQLSGDVLAFLLDSEKAHIRNHAVKNAIRRLVWLGQYTEAIRLYQTNKQCRSQEVLIAIRNHIGIAEFFLGNLDTAFSLFMKNFQAKKIENEKELGITKYMLGLIMTYRNEHIAKAKRLIEASILLFETTKYYHWTIVGLNGLSDLSYSLEQWSQALVYLNRSLEIAHALQNKTFLLFTLKNIARVSLRLYGAKSHELSCTVEAMENLLRTMEHNWVTMWAQNVLATVYAHKHELHKLSQMVDATFPLTEHYLECHIFTLSNLGHRAALEGDNDKARTYYKEAYTLCKGVKNPFARQEIRQDFIQSGFLPELQEDIWHSTH